MEMLYCKNCKKTTGHKRAIGMGTLLGGVATLGVSLAAVPFYPLRCVVCGCESQNRRIDPYSLGDDILSRKFTLQQLIEKHGVGEEYIGALSERLKKRYGHWTWKDHENLMRRVADTKECPYCAETIKKKATVCRYCGNDLVEPIIEDPLMTKHGITKSGGEYCVGGISHPNLADAVAYAKSLEFKK